MANCVFCDKKMSFLAGFNLAEGMGVKFSKKYEVCNDCYQDYLNLESAKSDEAFKKLTGSHTLPEEVRTAISARHQEMRSAVAVKIEREERQKIQTETLKSMKVTTGYNFEGYRITEYHDVIFDEAVFGMGFFKAFTASFDNIAASVFGEEASVAVEKLNEVKKTLRDRVKQKAVEMGANALLGVDFESSKMGDLMMVSMTATAVTIEKI